jgi:hypothetical protein
MSTHALSFRLDELSFTAQPSPEKMSSDHQLPCDQWKMWASKSSSSRKRKQQQNFTFLGNDSDDDLIENEHVDFRVESHMRLPEYFSCSERSLMAQSLPVEADDSVSQTHDDMVQQQLQNKKQRWADWCGESAASRRRRSAITQGRIIRNSPTGQASR